MCLIISLHNKVYICDILKDCVGALDGTHVPCVPPRETAELYRNRKGYFSLNVLAVCSFDMRFTYMLSGWEGSAHDARVLASALDHPRKRFPVPPPGKSEKRLYVHLHIIQKLHLACKC